MDPSSATSASSGTPSTTMAVNNRRWCSVSSDLGNDRQNPVCGGLVRQIAQFGPVLSAAANATPCKATTTAKAQASPLDTGRLLQG
jgi:hypothetical protein